MSRASRRKPTALWRAIRAIAWMAVLTVLAASGAGLVAGAWHPPGSLARAELTYPGDSSLHARLDAAALRLAVISAEVEKLASEAKTALAEVTSADPTELRQSLQRGGQAATAIEVESDALRAQLDDLPGTEPDAVLWYANATLVRRSTVVAAIDAAVGLAAQWRVVAARSTEAANLSALLTLHDNTVLDAASKGRVRAYENAIVILADALATVVVVQGIRTRLIAGAGNTVLDEWIQRNAAYDNALRALYQALINSDGRVTGAVQTAQHAERVAFSQLPPDRRTIVVILAEVSRGALTEAVVAIEDAHGRIDAALAADVAAAA